VSSSRCRDLSSRASLPDALRGFRTRWASSMMSRRLEPGPAPHPDRVIDQTRQLSAYGRTLTQPGQQRRVQGEDRLVAQ
jgi:hypothetical protein